MKLVQRILFLITLFSSPVLLAQNKVSKGYFDHNRKTEKVTYKEHVERATQYADSLNSTKSETLKHRNVIVAEFLAKEDRSGQVIRTRESERESFLEKHSREEVVATEVRTDSEMKDSKDAPSIQTDLVVNEKTKLIAEDSLTINESLEELQTVTKTPVQQQFTSEGIVESEPKTVEEKILSPSKTDTKTQPTERLTMENGTTTFLLQFAVLSERKNPSKVARSLGLPNNVNLMIRPKGQLFTYVTEAFRSFEEANTKAAEIHKKCGADVAVVDDQLNNVKYYSKTANNINDSENIQGIYLQVAFLRNKISLNEFQKRESRLHSQNVSIIKVDTGYKYVLGPFRDGASAKTKQAELKVLGVESYYYIHQ